MEAWPERSSSPEATPYPEQRMLQHDERVQIDLGVPPLADYKEVADKFGLVGTIVAAIAAGKHGFLIVKQDKGNEQYPDFLIIDGSYPAKNEHDQQAFKGIYRGSQAAVTIGKHYYNDRFQYDTTVSRDHFVVVHSDEGLFVENLKPKHGTTVLAHFVEQPAPVQPTGNQKVYAPHTHRALQDVRWLPEYRQPDEYAPYGYFDSHHIIGRGSSRIAGGAWLSWGRTTREVLTINESPELAGLYKNFVDEKHIKDISSYPLAVHRAVRQYVQSIMRYDVDGTKTLCEQYRSANGLSILDIMVYVRAQIGACRQQAVVAGYLEEQVIKDGYISGRAGLERNLVVDGDDIGAHAWAVNRGVVAYFVAGLAIPA